MTRISTSKRKNGSVKKKALKVMLKSFSHESNESGDVYKSVYVLVTLPETKYDREVISE